MLRGAGSAHHGLLMLMLMPNVWVSGAGKDMMTFMTTADSVILR